jgi:hypothetical protein
MGLIHRYLFTDFWVPVWPNIAAAALLALHVSKSNRKHRFYLGNKEGKDDQGN